MKQENPGTFINYKSLHSAYHIPCDEINSLLRDRFNNIWLGSIGGGVLMIDTKQSPFTFYSLNLAEDDVLLLPSALCLPMQIKTFGWVPEVMGWHARIMNRCVVVLFPYPGILGYSRCTHGQLHYSA